MCFYFYEFGEENVRLQKQENAFTGCRLIESFDGIVVMSIVRWIEASDPGKSEAMQPNMWQLGQTEPSELTSVQELLRSTVECCLMVKVEDSNHSSRISNAYQSSRHPKAPPGRSSIVDPPCAQTAPSASAPVLRQRLDKASYITFPQDCKKLSFCWARMDQACSIRRIC